MDRAKQRDLARQGGKAAHATGRAHQWTSAEAKVAGRKGGLATRPLRAERTDTMDTVADLVRDVFDDASAHGGGDHVRGADKVRSIVIGTKALADTIRAFEDLFDLDIPDEDSRAWVTVADVIRYLERRVGEQRATA